MSKEENTQIFIAKLSQRVTEKDLSSKFSKYGQIKSIQLRRGYAFIDYDDSRAAEKAVDRMDRRDFEGSRIVVEPARARSRKDSYDSRSRRPIMKKRGPQAEDKCYNCDKTGHWANECREPIKPRPQKDKDNLKCYKCGERGHIQKYCKGGNSRSHSRSRSRNHSRSSSSSRGRRYYSDEKRHSRKRRSSSSSSRRRRDSSSRSRSPRKSKERRSSSSSRSRSDKRETNGNNI